MMITTWKECQYDKRTTQSSVCYNVPRCEMDMLRYYTMYETPISLYKNIKFKLVSFSTLYTSSIKVYDLQIVISKFSILTYLYSRSFNIDCGSMPGGGGNTVFLFARC